MSVVRYIHQNPVAAGVVSDMDRYRWSSHRGHLYKSERPSWLNTHSVLSRFGRLKEYQEFMHSEIEKEVVDFYKGAYQRAILGDTGFIERVKERLGDRARVEEEKPESRSMAMYLCRTLGDHRHGEIGKVLGLEKTSSVSSVCLRMKARVEVEKKIARRAWKIKELLQKSQERTPFRSFQIFQMLSDYVWPPRNEFHIGSRFSLGLTGRKEDSYKRRKSYNREWGE